MKNPSIPDRARLAPASGLTAARKVGRKSGRARGLRRLLRPLRSQEQTALEKVKAARVSRQGCKHVDLARCYPRMTFQKIEFEGFKSSFFFFIVVSSANKLQTGGMFLREAIKVVEVLGSPPAMLDQP